MTNNFKKLIVQTKINALNMEHLINVALIKNELSFYDDDVKEFYSEIQNVKHALDMLEIELKFNKIGL